MAKSRKRIVIIDGHPDNNAARYVHALADAYLSGARKAGHEATLIEVGRLDFPLLRTAADFQEGVATSAIADAQRVLKRADHMVILYPLWLGSMPALLKGFLEQVLRPGFAFNAGKSGRLPRKLLVKKSARIVVTMGMPAFFYRWYFRAHSVKSLERNILSFVGFKPIRTNIVGMVESLSDDKRKAWLARMSALGEQAR